MSNQHSVTKRHRRQKSEKRGDSTARTMAAVKQLEEAAKKLALQTSLTLPSPANG
jgi:hypothetical protein